MAPSSDTRFDVLCDNQFEGDLSADALGITACLYAYSHLSFGGGNFSRECARHYHLLREYMRDGAMKFAVFVMPASAGSQLFD